MKQRNVMAVIFLSIITLGIYDLFWLANTKKTLNEQTDVKVPSMWLLFAPIIGIFVVAVMSIFTAGSTADGSSFRAASIFELVVGLVTVLGILPITFYWFLKFSKAVNHYTRGELNTAITFILLWILRFIGLAIIQDKFNDMAQSAGQQPVAAGASFSPAQPAAAPEAFGPTQSVEASAPVQSAEPAPSDNAFAPQPSVAPEAPATTEVQPAGPTVITPTQPQPSDPNQQPPAPAA